MKKLLLVSTLVFFLSNISFLSNTSFAAECATGTSTAPTDGCTITSQTGENYTLIGDISITASGEDGLFLLRSSNNTINLTGDITTLGGTGGLGMYLYESPYNTINVTGDITTTGINSYGLFLNTHSNNNTTTVTGDISTTGKNALGLVLTSSSNNITSIIGDISTTGDGADGIYLNDSDNNTTSIIGDISTTGDSADDLSADGLYLYSSDNNTTTVTGNITTTGTNAFGLVLLDSSNNTTTVTGNISTTGIATAALHLEGLFSTSEGNIINLTGLLSATGTNSNAIEANLNSNNNTITFNQGSKIIGGLDNDGTNNTLKFNLGGAASYNFTTSGDVDWVLEDTSKTVISGSAKSRGVADIDDSGNRLYQRFSQISSSLTKQHREVSYGEVRGSAWIDTYYNDSERDNVPSQINQNTRGVTMGFPVSSNSAVPIDVIVNYENSSVAYGLSEQNITSNSFMVGVALPELMKTKEGSLAMKLLAGLSNNDRDLTVLNNLLTSGKETVTDKYNSFYVNAGAEWMQRLYKNEYFQHDLIIGMDINHERIDSSAASGYYILDDREITQLVSQAQYGVTFTGTNKKLKINGSAGLAYSDIIDGEKQNYSIDGTAVSYTSDKNNTYAIASLGVRYQFTPLSYAYANVKRFESTDNIDGTTGNIALIVQF